MPSIHSATYGRMRKTSSKPVRIIIRAGFFNMVGRGRLNMVLWGEVEDQYGRLGSRKYSRLGQPSTGFNIPQYGRLGIFHNVLKNQYGRPGKFSGRKGVLSHKDSQIEHKTNMVRWGRDRLDMVGRGRVRAKYGKLGRFKYGRPKITPISEKPHRHWPETGSASAYPIVLNPLTPTFNQEPRMS